MRHIQRIKYIIIFIIALNIFYIIYLNILNTSKNIKNNSVYDFNFNIPFNELNKYIKNENINTNSSLKYHFLINQSNSIGGYRNLPDTRHSSCANKSYELPHSKGIVSVIIVYYNEARSTLLRTLTSILTRTSHNYLKEIILIDDFNEDVAQGIELKFLPYIKLIRNKQRLGAIESRNYGVNISTGKYIVFLDSHCEVNIGWIEPLLERLTLYPGVAVSPILDHINYETFQYTASSSNLKGGFDWNILFKWIPMTDEERESQINVSDPYTSPTFSGGVFMVSREWFLKLHGFNPLLQLWGGESIEMAIKLWLCGGKIEIVPCSRIGHVFQNIYPFDFPHGSYKTYLNNAKVIAESWLDEYKYIFYSTKSEANKLESIPINDSNLIKQNLQCRPFNWFLKVVFPEMKIPNKEYIAFGKIISGIKCLTVDKNDTSAPNVLMQDCYKKDITNWSLHSITGQLTTESGACLNVIDTQVQLDNCIDDESQRWHKIQGHIIHSKTQLCLEMTYDKLIKATDCRRGAPFQIFTFSVESQKL